MCNFHYLAYYCSPNLSIHQNSTQEPTWNFLVTLVISFQSRMMVRLAVIMILTIGLSHGIRIDMLDKMVDAVDFDNPSEIEALDKVQILLFKSIC